MKAPNSLLKHVSRAFLILTGMASKYELCCCFQEKHLQPCVKRGKTQNSHAITLNENDSVTDRRNIDCLKAHQLHFIIFFPSLRKYKIKF